MKAVRATPAGLEAVDVPEPEGPGVLVTVTSAGICGSDLHAIARGPSKVTLGHEFGGWTPDGRLVAVRPHLSCGGCAQCASGVEHLCRSITANSHGSTIDGASPSASSPIRTACSTSQRACRRPR
jgi:threonine dehydrogenase-like Zn-dependent dehydrogenase